MVIIYLALYIILFVIAMTRAHWVHSVEQSLVLCIFHYRITNTIYYTFKPEFTIVIFISYKPRIAVTIFDF